MISFFYKVLTEVKLRLPPVKDWKYQVQTNPPTFGWAKKIDEKQLNEIVLRRKQKCIELNQKYSAKDCVKGKVSIVVLSCKRWWTLERLMKTATPFFKNIENYHSLEKILVDNGSGEELINNVRSYDLFDKIIEHKENLGMVGALKDIFNKVDSEYILFFEDDFVLDFDKPFIQSCIDIFNEYPEIGIIRLKNQNNWWKPFRIISPLRKTRSGTEFWTWIPSNDGEYNVWAAGSVMFRRSSFYSVGELEDTPHVLRTDKKMNHAYLYENVFARKYNKYWLAAKIKGVTPFIQPNDNQQSPGWE